MTHAALSMVKLQNCPWVALVGNELCSWFIFCIFLLCYSSMIGMITSVSFVVYNFVSLLICTLSFLVKQFDGFHYFYREA